jgi:hypothetical protein
VNTPVLTAGRLEFEEIFKRLERDFKMTKAAVARALLIERSYVTMLINGQRTPHIRLLHSMRTLEKQIRTKRAPEPAEEETDYNRVCRQMKVLEQNDHSKFEAIMQIVESMAQSSASSKPVSAASKRLKKAVTLATEAADDRHPPSPGYGGTRRR